MPSRSSLFSRGSWSWGASPSRSAAPRAPLRGPNGRRGSRRRGRRASSAAGSPSAHQSHRRPIAAQNSQAAEARRAPARRARDCRGAAWSRRAGRDGQRGAAAARRRGGRGRVVVDRLRATAFSARDSRDAARRARLPAGRRAGRLGVELVPDRHGVRAGPGRSGATLRSGSPSSSSRAADARPPTARRSPLVRGGAPPRGGARRRGAAGAGVRRSRAGAQRAAPARCSSRRRCTRSGCATCCSRAREMGEWENRGHARAAVAAAGKAVATLLRKLSNARCSGSPRARARRLHADARARRGRRVGPAGRRAATAAHDLIEGEPRLTALTRGCGAACPRRRRRTTPTPRGCCTARCCSARRRPSLTSRRLARAAAPALATRAGTSTWRRTATSASTCPLLRARVWRATGGFRCGASGLPEPVLASLEGEFVRWSHGNRGTRAASRLPRCTPTCSGRSGRRVPPRLDEATRTALARAAAARAKRREHSANGAHKRAMINSSLTSLK